MLKLLLLSFVLRSQPAVFRVYKWLCTEGSFLVGLGNPLRYLGSNQSCRLAAIKPAPYSLDYLSRPTISPGPAETIMNNSVNHSSLI